MSVRTRSAPARDRSDRRAPFGSSLLRLALAMVACLPLMGDNT
jgi:hypothetical protein